MKTTTMVSVLVAAAIGLGVVACSSTAEDDVDQGAGAASASTRCGSSSPAALNAAIDASSTSSLKLLTAPRDPSSIPTGARSPKYIASLELKKTGKFSAKLNTGTKMKGTYTISTPTRAKNYVVLNLDPAGDEAEGLTFKVFHGKGSDFELPAGTFGFMGEGFTPFNMKTDGVVEEATDPAQSCNCEDLPRPRCPGAYVCEEGECKWSAPVGSRCGGLSGPI